MTTEVAAHPWGWRNVLYRLYDHGGRLLYVGITTNIDVRFREHRGTKWWWDQVADARTEFFPDRAALVDAERIAIRTEAPRYNVVHNQSRPAVPAPRMETDMREDRSPTDWSGLATHPMFQQPPDNITVESIEIHPDGLVVNGAKLTGLAISGADVAMQDDADWTSVTFSVTLVAASVTVSSKWLGERPPPREEEPEPEPPAVDF